MFPWAFQHDYRLHKERFNLDKLGKGINLCLGFYEKSEARGCLKGVGPLQG